MPVTRSEIVSIDVQKDLRAYISERHTFEDGHSEPVDYLCDNYSFQVAQQNLLIHKAMYETIEVQEEG